MWRNMKKDTLLTEKLNTLADCVQPDARLMNKARAYAKDNAAKKHLPWRRYIFAGAACLLVIVIGLGAWGLAIMIRGSLNKDTAPSYALSDLRREQGSDAQAAPLLALLSDAGSAELSRCYVYKDKSSGEILVIACEIVSVTDHGTDKLYVVRDIGKGLKDYQKYRNSQRITNENGVSVAYKEEYKNGEYYSYAYFALDDNDYYLVIGSPEQSVGNYYYKML